MEDLAAACVLKNCLFSGDILDDSSSSDATSSTASSDSDTEVLVIFGEKRQHITTSNYFETTVPMYSLEDFKAHFRMSRESVEKLKSNLRTSYIDVKGRPKISLEKGILISIWTLANRESYRSIADRFGMHKGHAHTVVLKICKMITRISDKYIVWPTGADAISNVNGFNNLRGNVSFPNVFGCVDGTHILIPGKPDNSYYNRKGTYSVLLQAICNYRKEIINVSCGWPGSFHDARMWKSSKIYEKLSTDMENWLPTGTYLIGDSAYPLDKFIMVPFRDNGHLTRQQKKFNTRLSSSRVLIENTYSRLKGLFRRLKFLEVYELKYIKYYLIASCALYNISLNDNILMDEGPNDAIHEEINNDPVDHEADQLRIQIMQNLI